MTRIVLTSYLTNDLVQTNRQMKFEHEEKRTPTFRTWGKTATVDESVTYPVVRIFANDDWRTITFVTDEFRINFKYDSSAKYTSAYASCKKILTKHCRCYVSVLSREKAEITLSPASDADETPQLFEADDLGFIPKAKS